MTKDMRLNYAKLAIAASLIVAACSSNDIDRIPNEEGTKMALQVQAHIATTRATSTAFEAGDAIGVYAISTVKGGLTSGTNVKYVAQQNTVYFTSSTPIYYEDKNSVDVSAYYPYSADVKEGELNVMLSAQTDYLYASASAVAFNTEDLELTFNHLLSKLSLTFVAGTGIDDLKNLSKITLKNLPQEATLNVVAGEITPATKLADYEVNLNEGAPLTLLVFPSTITAIDVVLQLGDVEYAATLKAKDGLTGGKNYAYTLTLTRAALTVTNSSITDWTDYEFEDEDDQSEAKIQPEETAEENSTK
jgi:hypothetical protein